MENILTDEHKELINKKIKKAINEVDFTLIVTDYIEREFDGLWDNSEVKDGIQDLVVEVIKEHLIRSGLLSK